MLHTKYYIKLALIVAAVIAALFFCIPCVVSFFFPDNDKIVQNSQTNMPGVQKICIEGKVFYTIGQSIAGKLDDRGFPVRCIVSEGKTVEIKRMEE